MHVSRLAPGLILLLAICVPSFAAERPLVAPRAAQAPAIDGRLDDECWKNALVIRAFTLPQRREAHSKPTEARVCFDESALYVAVISTEPNPDRLKAEVTLRGQQVWSDDCVELWVRTSPSASDYDQFIINPIGTQEEARHRDGRRVSYQPTWQAAARRADGAWIAELRIPAGDIGLDRLRRGDGLGLKIGRHDQVSQPSIPSIWPAQATYDGNEGYGTVYLEDDNVLVGLDLSRPEHWNIAAESAGWFSAAVEAGQPVIHVKPPANQRWTFSQSLRLRPGVRYRFAAEVRNSDAMLVRLRVPPGDGSDERIDTPLAASDDYQPVVVNFTAGPEGNGMVIFSGTAGDRPGQYAVRNARLSRIPLDEPAVVGPAIPVVAEAEPMVVTKLRIADSRVVRGFLTNPVDGSVRSQSWDGRTWEYNQTTNTVGVEYFYRNNDGLHLTFADDAGFHAVVVRGGIKANLVRDAAKYDDPESGQLVHQFPGSAQDSRAFFAEPVKTKRVSFFDVSDGIIADTSFYRIGPAGADMDMAKATRLKIVQAGRQRPHEPTALIRPHLASRFPADQRTIHRLDGPNSPYPADPITLPANKAVHLISEPFRAERAISAIGLDFVVEGDAKNIPFTIRVQDPVNPRLELHGADYVLDSAGRVRIICDFPGQIIPEGQSLWLTLRFDQAVTLNNVAVAVIEMPNELARAEALEHRKFLLRGLYVPLSEARPWNTLSRQEDIDRYLGIGNPGQEPIYRALAPWVAELLTTLDQCRRLDPEGRDDTLRQYYQWIYRNILRRSPDGMPPFETKFNRIDGVPEWAVLLHQAWMQARAVPKWWIDNRLVPTGEFGGSLQDDSDMYQNYVVFPFFERDGVGGELLQAAARLAELAELNHLEGGLNRHAMDPLHAYEEGINHLSLMALWHYGDPVYFERCMVNAANTAQYLTIVTDKGHRHFKNPMVGSADMRMQRPAAGETGSHVLLWHPTMIVADYNRNPRALQALREWGDGWLEHQQPGQYAAGIRLPEDVSDEVSEQPFPGMWGSAGSIFVFLSDLTGDSRYVKPYVDYWTTTGRTESGAHHVPEVLQLGLIPPANDGAAAPGNRWNTVLYQTGDKRPLVDALRTDIEELQRFRHMYTTVECFTDRVFLYAAINPSIAYTGGYTTRNKLNHNYAISYDGFGTDYAALVTVATRDRLKVLLCNVSDRPISGRVHLWRLDHGEYRVTFGPDRDGDDQADALTLDQGREIVRGDALELTLPPKVVHVLELRQVRKLGGFHDRPDLAISPLELRVEPGKVTTRVHNIGARDAQQVIVAIVDRNGKELRRKQLGALAAPLDLVPKVVDVEFTDLPADLAGGAIVVDPDNALEEIYEGNNRLPLQPATSTSN